MSIPVFGEIIGIRHAKYAFTCKTSIHRNQTRIVKDMYSDVG